MKEKIKSLMDKGYLLDPDVLDILDNNSLKLICAHINPLSETILTKGLISALKEKYCDIEEGRIDTNIKDNCSVKIVEDYEDDVKKVEVHDFVEHYKIRYNFLRKILQTRLELSDTISINRVFGKMEREKVSLIGLVLSKDITKNNNILLEIEDPSGSIKVLITSNKEENYRKAQDVVLDEVIGIVGSMGNGIVFVNELFFPDVPLNNVKIKKSPVDESVAIISDLHLGSKNFLEDEFIKFINWLNGETGTFEQKKVAKSVKYLFVVGDIIAGVGVYPGQEEELKIIDIKDQFKRVTELFGMVREDIEIIISPGNHDSVRLAEPQPKLDKKYAGNLLDLPNITFVSNPSVVNVGACGGFLGFDILLYHGFGFSYYIDKVDRLRIEGGYDKVDTTMKFLLQKRHLSPSHTSTLFIVDPKRDGLVIKKVPDFFMCGHAHKFSMGQYGKTTFLSGSCWETKTKYQLKGGHNPVPGRVPIINLKTRDVKLMKFYD
ncbi:metallophosphoesterase [archaeon]|nr:metallophosphoesterase [archaeon]